jgi:hypothetical protein
MSLRKTFVKSGAYSTGSRFNWRYSNQSFRNMTRAWAPIRGWHLPVRFLELDVPLSPKAHMAALKPVLPEKYSPLRPTGARSPGVYLASISEAMAGVLRHVLAEQIEDIEAQIQAAAGGVRQAGDRPARRHGLFERPGNCFTFSCSTRPVGGASSDLAGPPGQIARLARARQTQAERSSAPLLAFD